MVKKIFLLLSCVFCFQLAIAQTMSDEQIMDFVLTEQGKGSDQRTIATKLLQKGVSHERIRDIKTKYDAEKSLMGASDLVGNKKNIGSRSRAKNEDKLVGKIAGKKTYADKMESWMLLMANWISLTLILIKIY